MWNFIAKIIGGIFNTIVMIIMYVYTIVQIIISLFK